MKLTMLGTGNALATARYNTCFVLSDGDKHFMVDGGGGNGVFRQLSLGGFDWMDMREIFVTHKHIDHLLGIVWMTRMICQFMTHGEYKGEANIYANDEVIGLLRNAAKNLLPDKENHHVDGRLHLIAVKDGEEKIIHGHKTVFFDIHSRKAKQFGFRMELGNGGTLSCCGDEPYNENCESFVKGSTWLLHEAFCLHSQAEIFDPYEKHHSTVRDACQTAARLGVENLLLYHTEDKTGADRKRLYLEEGRPHFSGRIFVPEDLEVLPL